MVSSWCLLRSVATTALLALVLGFAPAGCGDDDDGHGDHDHPADGGDADAAHEEGSAGDGDHDHDPSKPIGTPSGATCPDGSTLSYESFGKAFMDKYCVRCHSSELESDSERMGAPEGHDFDSLPGILGVAEHVDQYAAKGPDATNTMMPPSGERPTLEEREQLGEWLACELDKID